MCCGQPSSHDMHTHIQEWWRTVWVGAMVRKFQSIEAAEEFLSRDINTMSDKDSEVYAKLLYQKELAEG